MSLEIPAPFRRAFEEPVPRPAAPAEPPTTDQADDDGDDGGGGLLAALVAGFLGGLAGVVVCRLLDWLAELAKALARMTWSR